MSCSHSGTASGVCLFNHSCRNEIKRQCVVKSLKLLPQQRDQEGPTAGSRVKNKPGLAMWFHCQQFLCFFKQG